MNLFNKVKSFFQSQKTVSHQFELSFNGLEELLRVYKKLDLSDEPVTLNVSSVLVKDLSVSYPSKERNVLQTLKFTIDGMNSSYYNGQSKIYVKWEQLS